ncbi:MAG: hypothetical protein QE494_16425 [Ramlibacter sp.]|nr:hypothetical protein [Ramlibacter sp.]MDH4377880.1 hypothetical protein [Ramlibacter sp.]
MPHRDSRPCAGALPLARRANPVHPLKRPRRLR